MYKPNEFKNDTSLVNYVISTWQKYRESQQQWAISAKEDMEFRLGRQWTEDEVNELQRRGLAPIVVNRIHPAVELLKSILTSNSPSFRVLPREDSDKQVSYAVSALLEYIFYISDGKNALRQIIDDYSTCGRGAAIVYIDKYADSGRGEVKFRDISVFDVYPDPNAQDWFCDDAEHIFYSREFTKSQLLTYIRANESFLKNVSGSTNADSILSGNSGTKGLFFREDVSSLSESEKVRVYEMYSKIKTKRYSVYEKHSEMELDFDKKGLEEYVKMPAYIFAGKVVTPEVAEQIRIQQVNDAITIEQKLKELKEDFDLKKKEIYVKRNEGIEELNGLYNSGQLLYERYSLELDRLFNETDKMIKEIEMAEANELAKYGSNEEVQEVTNAELIANGYIDVVEYEAIEIEVVCVIGDKLYYTMRLPIDYYPIVFIMNLHTRTPYPLSDVRMVKEQQRYLNKMYQLTMSYMTNMSTPKILVPRGSVDKTMFQEEWLRQSGVVEVDMELGAPIPWTPPPLPNQLFLLENQMKSDIEYQFGLFELMMGNASAAPNTFKATISIDEFGQRRVRSKQIDLEIFLTRLGRVILDIAQLIYKAPKIIRVLQPNNTVLEYAINNPGSIDYYQDSTIRRVGDISTYKYDVVVVSGSTMPTNRYAMMEMYERLYAAGVIDQVEFLKKTDVFDVEGVLERSSQLRQMAGFIEQLKEEIGKLKGDLETKDREIQNLRNKVEVTKFSGNLDRMLTQSSAATHVTTERLKDEIRNIRSNNQIKLDKLVNSVERRQISENRRQQQKRRGK